MHIISLQNLLLWAEFNDNLEKLCCQYDMLLTDALLNCSYNSQSWWSFSHSDSYHHVALWIWRFEENVSLCFNLYISPQLYSEKMHLLTCLIGKFPTQDDAPCTNSVFLFHPLLHFFEFSQITFQMDFWGTSLRVKF